MPAYKESVTSTGPAVATPPKPVLWAKVTPEIAMKTDVTINLAGAKTQDLLTAAEKGGNIKLPGNLNTRMKETFGVDERAREEIHHVSTAGDAEEFLSGRFNITGSGDPLYLVQRMMEAAGQ